MKKAIGIILAIFSPLASVPTGWAIYAGVRNIPAFPMPMLAAVIGAASIVVVILAASDMLLDVIRWNGSLTKSETTYSQPVLWSWGLIGLAIVSELSLSLVIVVWQQIAAWGVTIFPLMTLAGALTFAVRADLTARQAARDVSVAEAENERERKRKERELARQQQAKAKAERKQAKEKAKASKVPCEWCGKPISDSQNARNAHANYCKVMKEASKRTAHAEV